VTTDNAKDTQKKQWIKNLHLQFAGTVHLMKWN